MSGVDSTTVPATRDPALAVQHPDEEFAVLRFRERFRENYWLRRDPIYRDRLRWRAHTFRHLVHLLPGQSILEIGCGQGLFTQALAKVSRGRNPITAVSLDREHSPAPGFPENAEFLCATSLPGELAGRQFDFVVAMDLLDRRNAAWFASQIHDLLKPGGQVVFYESNPWNVVLKLRRALSRLLRGVTGAGCSAGRSSTS